MGHINDIILSYVWSSIFSSSEQQMYHIYRFDIIHITYHDHHTLYYYHHYIQLMLKVLRMSSKNDTVKKNVWEHVYALINYTFN